MGDPQVVAPEPTSNGGEDGAQPVVQQATTNEDNAKARGAPSADADGGGTVPRKEVSPGTLSKAECFWRDRQVWLQEKGYMLRPRYRPNWKPSWEGTSKEWFRCEDGRTVRLASLLDATRMSDNKLVMLKRISRTSHPDEVEIAQFFSSQPLASDPRNHCVPIHEVLQDPEDQDLNILVMPFLRVNDDPPLNTVGEAISFYTQIFEGLLFMHEHHVAHRDCMSLNIMMDPEPMFPDMYHPIFTDRKRNFRGTAKQYSRTEKPPKYYLIDFGLSSKYAADNPSPHELPVLGGDRTVPEFQGDKFDEESDPFPTDVYYLGNAVRESHLQGFRNLGFMQQLVDDMTQSDPTKRPTMSEVVMRFNQIRSSLTSSMLRRRLVGKDEGVVRRLLYDLRHICVSFGYFIRSLPPVPEPAPK